MSAFTKRLERQGPPLAISAVDVKKLTPPFKTEICLQRALLVDDGDGLGRVINAVAHCELAPLLVGGTEAVRLMLATGDLIRDWLALGEGYSRTAPNIEHLAELAGEMREALQRINSLADSITAAKAAATAEHDAFHAAEAKPKGAIH